MKNLNTVFDLLLFPFHIVSTYFKQRHKERKKLLFVLASFFIFLNLNSYAEDEPNNSCTQASVILEYGTYSYSDSGSSSLEDHDFYSFDAPEDGELNVTIENTSTSKSLTYSSLSTACPSSTPSTLLKSSSTTITIPSTSAGKYYIYVEGVAKSPPTGYTISARFTPNTLSDGIDLKITKAGSIDTTLIYDDFYYTINVSNIGEDNASGVVVTDSLPNGMSVNLPLTNAAPWNCIGETDVTTCTLDGNLTTGSISSIILYVNAPSTAGTITNEVNVTSDGEDVDTSNNTATETTEIINEVDTAENLCYTEYTELEPADYNATCEKKGNFYYGNTCEAYVAITDVNITSNLSDIIIYKMYAPDVSSGACTYTTDGSDPTNAGSPCNNIDNATDFGGYHGGYAIDTNTSISNANDIEILINDIGTDNNPRVYSIAMFGDYITALGFHHTGRIYACSNISEGGIEITSSADVIDTFIADSTTAGYYNGSKNTSDTDNNIKYIRTMVAADQTREIIGVYLDLAGLSTPYVYNGSENFIPYIITPILTDNDCNEAISENIIDPVTHQQLVIEIPEVHPKSGTPLTTTPYYSASKSMIVSETVRKNARIKMIFVNPNTLNVEGQRCLANSSTTGNFARLAQCVNSEVQYKTAFGQDAWDRCGEGNGNPCVSANHGYSCGENDTTCVDHNPLYDNELGCYMCTFNIQPSCSTDNFAIRPDRFIPNIIETNIPPHYPNLLRSGENYDTTLTAINADTAISSSYSVLNFHNIVQTPNTKKYFNGPSGLPWVEDIGGLLLHGTATPIPRTPSYMVNGISRLSNTSGGAEAIVGVTFDDVSRVGIYVADVNWSQVDNDDTPMDCNSSEHTYICGELNVTFIPHHFGFEELNITNHAGPDSNFTYIADNRGMPETTPANTIRSPMAARIHTQIKALTKDGNITKNFKAEDPLYPYDETSRLYYENNVSVSFVVTVPSIGTNKYLYPDANETNTTTISHPNLYNYIGFGRVGIDSNGSGTRDILWNESDFPLEFNFHRTMNEPANPFDVNGSYLKSIKIVSHYMDPEDGDTADIKGSRISNSNTSTCIAPPAGSCVQSDAENNATFYYARTRPSQFFYDNITTSPATTPIYIDVYCDLGYTACGDYDINTVSGYINAKWWLSWDHKKSQGDGNISLTVVNTNGGVSAPPKPNIDNSEGADKTVEVTYSMNPLPYTVDIDFITSGTNYTNAWLIYNKDTDAVLQAVPSPFYRVRFIGTGTWSTTGNLPGVGHVVGDDVNTKKVKRVEW